MKDQYFGDVNDFRKYGLLRSLMAGPGLRLGVCWMLTEADGTSDGGLLSYLDQPETYRRCDVELFDWLKLVVGQEQDRRTSRFEKAGLLGNALFHSEVLTNEPSQRTEYFRRCRSRFADCDLVFFDPDNGLEVKTWRRNGSCKYLCWQEVREVTGNGSSVLIYQHFHREEREKFIGRMAKELRRHTGLGTVFSFRTPRVLFLLASQDRHTPRLQEQLQAVRMAWGAGQMDANEHTVA